MILSENGEFRFLLNYCACLLISKDFAQCKVVVNCVVLWWDWSSVNLFSKHQATYWYEFYLIGSQFFIWTPLYHKPFIQSLLLEVKWVWLDLVLFHCHILSQRCLCVKWTRSDYPLLWYSVTAPSALSIHWWGDGWRAWFMFHVHTAPIIY